MHIARTSLGLLSTLFFAACPADDTTTSDSQGDSGSTAPVTASAGSEDTCTPETEGCTCDNGGCQAGLVCVNNVCEIDTESESGPSTNASADSSSTDGSSSATDESSTASSDSGSETGTMTCTDSSDCAEGEVCTAPPKSPGVPAEDFACSRTCAGLGPDAYVCTDDASCCGTFCDQGSCLAP